MHEHWQGDSDSEANGDGSGGSDAEGHSCHATEACENDAVGQCMNCSKDVCADCMLASAEVLVPGCEYSTSNPMYCSAPACANEAVLAGESGQVRYPSSAAKKLAAELQKGWATAAAAAAAAVAASLGHHDGSDEEEVGGGL